MEQKDNKPAKHKDGEVTTPNGTNVFSKQIESLNVWRETITVIDLSERNIEILDDTVSLPVNLVQLNLSHNKLVEVPAVVLNLEKLVILNVSHNMIQYFDDRPKFCHTLELLDISYNNLEGPPYWIWVETPQKLTQLNLSSNGNITKSLINGNFEELLQYCTLVIDIHLENCSLSKCMGLVSTFPKAKSVCLGDDNYRLNANCIIEIPFQGLDNCGDLKRLNACNTHIYTIGPSIEMYKNLIEINLAMNSLNGIPNEFCNLENLEICVLSCNKILYLPEDMYKLKKLVRLYLDNNELCMLPETLRSLSDLKTLDLYNNHLNDVPDNLDVLDEIDLALNYFEEPECSAYLEKKEKLRLTHENRYNGRKNVIEKSDGYSEKDSEDEDDEELYEIFLNGKIVSDPKPNPNPPSSPEDWDSDDYWVPFHQNHIQAEHRRTPLSPWHVFIKQKIKEGNYCPMDAHPVSISEKVKYEKQCNPEVNYESDGQFDDYSSDNT